MSAKDAQKLAYEKDLDLVKIAPQAKPPVCRIMNYGKYCFEQQKREKEARKNQKVVAIKEIRMFSAIDTHDFETKINQAKKFLQGGDKLKVSVRFRKRAIAHPQIGEELLERFKEACTADHQYCISIRQKGCSGRPQYGHVHFTESIEVTRRNHHGKDQDKDTFRRKEAFQDDCFRKSEVSEDQ